MKKQSNDNYNVDKEHMSGPNGCHEDCPACSGETKLRPWRKSISIDEATTYMVTDAVCGIIHAAMDMGANLGHIREKVDMAFEHAIEERKLTSEGYCSHCERKQ